MPELNPDTMNMLVDYGINVLAAVLTLVVGWLFAAWLGRSIQRRAARTKTLDPTLAIVVGKTVRAVVLVLTLTAVLSQFGVQTASLIALIGAAGLAIGLALQGALSNVASGIMLLILRPFQVGDLVDFGDTGVVDEIGLFVTRMHTVDNISMIVPNSRIWGNVIRNFATNDTRRIDLVFGIGYGDDIDKAIRVISETIAADSRLLKDPAPLVSESALADSSVNLYARPWVGRSDFFSAKLDLMKKVKERFDAEGISIPFPQRDIHVFETARNAA